jgi:uncharacterized repeat protein (TIGR01451 family)
MGTTIKRNLLLFALFFMSSSVFGQSFNINFVNDSTGFTQGCDSVATLDFFVDLWIPGSTADNMYFIGTNGAINPGDQIIVTVDWGDGSSNTYTGVYTSPTSPLFPPGTVEHVYPFVGGTFFPITVTVSNPINGSSVSNNNYGFAVGCPSYFYGFVDIDCDSNGVVDTSMYAGVDMILTGSNGTTYPFTLSPQLSINLPNDTYTLSVDPAWLAANNYIVGSLFPTTIPVTAPFGSYTFQATLHCDSVPPVTDGCVYGQVFCDDNGNGVFDPGEAGVYNAPVSISYNGQQMLTYTDPNGIYSFNTPNGNQAVGIVSVDANWLGQNGYQFNSNVYTVIIQPCQTQNAAIANFPVDCSYATPPMECIYGWVFCDANGNGTLDSGEVVLPNAPVEVSGNTGYTTTIYSDSNGVISYSSQAFFGGYAILTIPQWWLTQHGYALTNNIITVQTDCNNPTPAYFAVDCSPVLCADLWTAVTPWIGYYQNNNNYIKLKWGNNGPNPTTGYTLTLTFPSSVTPNTASIANSNYVISGNTITWTFGPGSAYIYQQDVISFFVPSGYPSGTSHTYSSTITPLGSTADCNLLNNDGSLCMILGNSYDPNDKSTSHAPIIDPTVQDELTYVVRFQNTGTAPAQDVYIIDTLSTNLDWSTLQVVSTSHNMQLVDLGNGVMKFNFPGIWLPDSTANEPESHGDVVFRIKENTGNGIGTSIENTAYIYFDWNPAIITNTVVNTNDALGLEDATINEVSIAPNPSTGSLRIISAEFMDRISIVDLAGKVIFETNASGFNTQLELSHLKSGVYLVKVASGSEISTERLIMK